LSSLSSLQGHDGTPHASQDQDCGGKVAAGGEDRKERRKGGKGKGKKERENMQIE
jgi:hypothetical protein